MVMAKDTSVNSATPVTSKRIISKFVEKFFKICDVAELKQASNSIRKHLTAVLVQIHHH
jgi:hypothetical protein